jgi:hypothetical protein
MRPCLELLPAPFLWRNEQTASFHTGLIILKDVARLQHMAEDVP